MDKMITDKMTIDPGVFSLFIEDIIVSNMNDTLFMEDIIVSNMNGTLIVTIKRSSRGCRHT